MQKIVLNFPLLNGGEEEGLNNPGTETFKGKIDDYLARECAQNTADAVVGENAELHFSLMEFKTEELPCSDELQTILSSCREYWIDDKKSSCFFEKAQSYLQNHTVKVLKISDYGTSGLTGNDDDKRGKWYGLVRSSGVSNKTEGAAGSFGIGKYAPFAASGILTAFYSTQSIDGWAFQGVSRLVTHLNGEGEKTQGTGYIGFYDANDRNAPFKSVRNGNIPIQFTRNANGTDIYIPAYLPAYDTKSKWEDNLIISVVNSFWLSVCLGKISFKISDTMINQSNIDDIIKKYKNTSGFEAYKYYDAYRNGQIFRKKIDRLGDVEFRIVERKQKERPPVTYARASGMSIGSWGYFRSRKPFSGVFICHGEEGNEVLRQMEPPRHDMWDENRHAEGQAIIGSIKQWIKECIVEMFPLGETNNFEIDALSKYLQAEEHEVGEESFDDEKQKDNQDGFESTPVEPRKNFTKTVYYPPKNEEDEEGEQTEIPSGSSVGGEGESDGSGIQPKGGDGQNTGGRPNIGGAEGDICQTKTASIRVLSCRSFFDSSDKSHYVILRTKKEFSGKISFGAECDDGTVEPLWIENATPISNHVMTVLKDGSYIQIELEPQTAAKLKITFKQKDKMALRIV